MSKTIVIGSGFSGLSVATHLADKGHEVVVLEKNSSLGGRARVFEAEGFTFDMGPSWYWMPDVIESYFNHFGKKVSDYYELVRLDPSYSVFFNEERRDVPAEEKALYAFFESLEKGSANKLKQFLAEAEYKYAVGIAEFVRKPGLSLLEYLDVRVFQSMFKLDMLTSIAKVVDQKFKHPQLREILKFPVLFLGATPENTPALYSLMNYADLKLGTWYPMGGMHQLIKAMVSLAEEKGVKFYTDKAVSKINYVGRQVKSVSVGDEEIVADYVISSADYQHTEEKLLGDKANYSEKYWNNRTMAPSSLLFYLGVDEKVDGLKHHNLFFDEDFALHADEIYTNPKWPTKPLFYACCPSKTDSSVAPVGKENLFLLVPLAPDLNDSDILREEYYNKIMDRLEQRLGQNVRDKVIYKRSYCLKDFKDDYNAYKGNAYGLANTLKQTGPLKPRIKSKHLDNFYYTGQLTNPGPGVPPSIISGEVVANQLIKDAKSK